nr:uncharacterized protein LOC129382962 [Dermacentor andersoni]
MDIDAVLRAAEEKIREINRSKQDVGIHRRLLLDNFVSVILGNDRNRRQPRSRKRTGGGDPSSKAKKQRHEKERTSSGTRQRRKHHGQLPEGPLMQNNPHHQGLDAQDEPTGTTVASASSDS